MKLPLCWYNVADIMLSYKRRMPGLKQSLRVSTRAAYVIGYLIRLVSCRCSPDGQTLWLGTQDEQESQGEARGRAFVAHERQGLFNLT